MPALLTVVGAFDVGAFEVDGFFVGLLVASVERVACGDGGKSVGLGLGAGESDGRAPRSARAAALRSSSMALLAAVGLEPVPRFMLATAPPTSTMTAPIPAINGMR